IYVFFPEEQKVGVKTMKTYTNRMRSENVFRAILVVQQSLTPFARTCISEISTKFHLEVFQRKVVACFAMVLSEDETNRLFRIRKTVMQMLKDQGHLVANFEVDMIKDQFRRKYGESMKREDLVINKTKQTDSSDQ
ncbi:dna-directed rna polymerases ii and iv subunit 5a, partial [Quercus suber]